MECIRHDLAMLQSTMDVIEAARRISEAGTKLDKLAGSIAEQCPDSSSKQDLLAYLERIRLYCHQLNITSKVKADVQSVGGELIVSGVSILLALFAAVVRRMFSSCPVRLRFSWTVLPH